MPTWVTPRTWTGHSDHSDSGHGDVAGEIVTSPQFNEQIRDNLTVLKTPFDNSGKVAEISTTYFASVDGTSLTDVAKVGSANTFTTGNTNFNAGSGTRLVAPVGTDRFDGSAGNKTAGSLWVEGADLHWVDASKNEWAFTGTSNGSPGGGALPGSIWAHSSGNGLHYIDASGVDRIVTGTAGHSDAGAVAGSLWVQGSYLYFVPASPNAYQCHLDTHANAGHVNSHSNVAHNDVHSNVAHSDIAHGDAHQDSAHGDVNFTPSHTNTAHSDVAHTDSHTDVPHTNSHANAGHADSHNDKPTSLGT
jgi:hypothetical protein